MKMTSDYWDESIGVCTKHWLPETPCPQCLATADTDVHFRLDDYDKMALEIGDASCIADLLPKGFSAETHTIL